jgi:predicted nucleotidyltransferase
MSSEIESAVVRVLQGEGTALASAYLFGSVAEGREHRESDLDIAILFQRQTLPTARRRFDRRLLLSSMLASATGRSVDLVVLNDTPPLFARRIVVDGRRILRLDAEADHAFIRDVQLRAADLEPFIRRTRATKLDRLRKR